MGLVPLADALDAVGFGKFQFLLYAMIGLGNCADGMEMFLLIFLFAPLQAAWGVEETDIGLIGSVFFVGMFFGAVVFGMIADKWSRRWTIVISLSSVAVGGFLSAGATSLAVMCLCRFLVGVGIGGEGPSGYAIVSEFTPPKHRGTVLVLLGIAWSVGGLVVTLFAFLLIGNSSGDAWRVLVTITAAVPLTAAVMALSFLPESPRTLALRNEEGELNALLHRAAVANGTEQALDKLLTGNTIQVQAVEASDRGSLLDLFSPGLRVTTVCVWFLWIVHIFVYDGLIVILPAVVKRLSSGADMSNNLYVATFVSCLVDITGSAVAGGVTDLSAFPTFGRGQQLMMYLLIASVLSVVPIVYDGSLAVVVGLMLAIKLMFCMTAALAWTYTTELYPTVIRATGLGSASAVGRIGGVLTPVVSLLLLQSDLQWPFVLYGVVALLAAGAVYGIPAETKGADLNDTIQEVVEQIQESDEEKRALLQKAPRE